MAFAAKVETRMLMLVPAWQPWVTGHKHFLLMWGLGDVVQRYRNAPDNVMSGVASTNVRRRNVGTVKAHAELNFGIRRHHYLERVCLTSQELWPYWAVYSLIFITRRVSSGEAHMQSTHAHSHSWFVDGRLELTPAPYSKIVACPGTGIPTLKLRASSVHYGWQPVMCNQKPAYFKPMRTERLIFTQTITWMHRA